MQTTEKTKKRETPGRREQVIQAALEVLGELGSKGLTHRAVDNAAGVPQGSTTNFFPTRSKLLQAALRRHVELDTPPTGYLAGISDLKLTRDEARELVMAALDRLLEPSARPMLAARYELVLESNRRPDLHAEFEPARANFVGLAEALLRARDCHHPEERAVQLVAVLDGVLMDQLLNAPSALTRRAIEDLVDRQLDTC